MTSIIVCQRNEICLSCLDINQSFSLMGKGFLHFKIVICKIYWLIKIVLIQILNHNNMLSDDLLQ